MRDLSDLLDDRRGPLGIGMPQRVDRDPGVEVQKSPAVRGLEPRPAAAGEDDRRAGIGLEDESGVGGDDRLGIDDTHVASPDRAASDHRARSLVRQPGEVDDPDPVDPALHRSEGRPDLRHHPAGDRAVLYARLHVAGRQLSRDRPVDKHPRNIRDEVELSRAERRGDGGGGRVGVHVVRAAVFAQRDGRQNGHYPFVDEPAQHLGPHGRNLADEADIHPSGLELPATQQPPIGAAQALRVDAGRDQRADQTAVHGAGEHHADDLHRIGIGHAKAVDMHRFQPQPRLELSDRRTAAMHDNRHGAHRRDHLADSGRDPGEAALVVQQPPTELHDVHVVLADPEHQVAPSV